MGERRTRVWQDGKLHRQDVPQEELVDYLGTAGTLVWLDLCDPQPDEMSAISTMLGLDALAVEDALAASERAKLDRYPGHLFLNLSEVILISTAANW